MQALVDRNFIIPATEGPAWKALEAHYREIRKLHLRDLFAEDPKRGERLAAEAVGVYLDYSKNRINRKTLELLLQLAEESGMRARIDAMFHGDKINITEKRAALHIALRAPREGVHRGGMGGMSCPRFMPCSTKWLISAVECERASGKVTPAKRIRNVVNIGIGGSVWGR